MKTLQDMTAYEETCRREQAVIMHCLVNVKIGARWSIKTGQQLVHNNKQLHVCWLFNELSFCLSFKFFYFPGNPHSVLTRVYADHVQVGGIFLKGLGVLIVTDCIGAQIPGLWRIRGNDRALVKTFTLENLIILAGGVNRSCNKDCIA